MANMELILKKPIEELVPAMISFNNEELKKEVQARLKKYNGLVYDDNEIGKAKADRALLNNFSNALNDARIKVRRQYEEPYLKFKNEVDEVISLVNDCVGKIGVQIKTYEETRKLEKLEEIKEYFFSKIGELSSVISYEKINEDKWLNIGSTMKSIQNDIDKKIEKIGKEITTIDTLKSPDEQTIKAYYFRNLNLSDALMQAEALRAERERIAELKTKDLEQKEQLETVNSPEPQKQKGEEKTYKIKFEVTATMDQLNRLKECLLVNQINYKKI